MPKKESEVKSIKDKEGTKEKKRSHKKHSELFKIQINCYDISGGYAAKLAKDVIGIPLEGIWYAYTAFYLFFRLFYF